jgi:hypothetical protein
MEMNVGKNSGNKNVNATIHSTDYDRSKEREMVEYFKYLGGLIINDARCTHEMKSRIAMAKAAFNKKKILFAIKLDLHLREKLVKCYTWCKTLYGAETWSL